LGGKETPRCDAHCNRTCLYAAVLSNCQTITEGPYFHIQVSNHAQ